jgi:metal-responsive CopG/Arc/MetJ family transcriptional regulator
MVLWRPTKNINLSLPEELLVEVDEAAKSKYMSRTEYIRYVLHQEVGGQYPKKIQEVAERDPTRFLDLDDS